MQDFMMSRLGKACEKKEKVLGHMRNAEHSEEDEDVPRDFRRPDKAKIGSEESLPYHIQDTVDTSRHPGTEISDSASTAAINSLPKNMLKTLTSAFKAPKRPPLVTKIEHPGVGNYNPKYHAFFAASPKWPMGKSKKTSAFDQFKTSSLSCTMAEFYPAPKVKGAVKFETQVTRKEFSTINPHESRFENFNALPEVSTKYKTTKLVEIKKRKGRQPIFTGECVNPIQYSPKVDLIKERLTKGAVKFERMSKRRELFVGDLAYTKNSTCVEKVNNYYTALSRVKSIPEFDKSPKVVDSMPRYFQNMYSRLAVGIRKTELGEYNEADRARFLLALNIYKKRLSMGMERVIRIPDRLLGIRKVSNEPS